MAFYTPTWVRRLVKEDHKNIQEHLNKQGNDFRTYIDATTPFVLWLDISLIRERILNKSADFIKELAEAVSTERDVSQIVMELLDKAYVATINSYAENPRYKKINSEELEALLTILSNAELGNVKKAITDGFNRTMVVTNVTKKNKSVMLILPKFTTLAFGDVYKTQLEKLVKASKKLKESSAPAIGGMFGALATGDGDSEKSRMLDFVSSNFSKLQNVGHVEVDVVSEVDRKIMRAQNSPRLLQALVTLPNDIKSFERLQLKFSKETGQATTRVKVRKQFSGSKMVFEMLVEHGLAVGIPETQADNLYKAKLERAFGIGRGLSATLRNDISILANLETSKSVNQFIEAAIVSGIRSVPIKPYNKETSIVESSKVTRTRVVLPQTKKKPSSSNTSTISNKVKAPTSISSLPNLLFLLNSRLSDRIKENMGSGGRKDILNLRSGRFAESVSVERLSLSRQGMITAFYSYMQNPYATFSAGGKQQYPRSRDPKLLISKSIREIMAENAITNMRSVLV